MLSSSGAGGLVTVQSGHPGRADGSIKGGGVCTGPVRQGSEEARQPGGQVNHTGGPGSPGQPGSRGQASRTHRQSGLPAVHPGDFLARQPADRQDYIMLYHVIIVYDSNYSIV